MIAATWVPRTFRVQTGRPRARPTIIPRTAVRAPTLLLALVPVVCPPAPAAAPDPAALGRLAVKTYSDADGLPQNSIMAIAFDREGTLWVGTQDGAARFNGRHWTVVDMPRRTVSNYVRAVLPASDGSLWFGTDGGGLHRLKDRAWTSYDTSGKLPSNLVYALLEAPAGTIWIGTRGGGLARFRDGGFTVFDRRSGLGADWVTGLAAEPATGALWVGTNGGGLSRLEGDRITRTHTTADGLPHNVVWSLLEASDQSLWVGTNGGGMAHLANGAFTTYDTRHGLTDNVVTGLLETTSEGGRKTLWIATNNKVSVYEDGVFRAVDTQLGLPDNMISRLARSPFDAGSRTVWVGTNGGGLARLTRGKWRSLDMRAGLPDNGVYAMQEDGDGVLWIGTRKGLARFEGGAFRTLDTSSGLPDSFVYSLAESRDKDGQTLWIGTRNGGLVRRNAGHDTVYSTKNGLPNDSIRCLLVTRGASGEPELWAGTNGGGLAVLSGGAWTVHTPASGLPDDVVLSLLATHGAIWAGTRGGGLARWKDGAWTRFDVKTGLPNDRVYALHETGGRYLWAGTAGGLARLDLERPQAGWTVLSDSTSPALPNNVVYRIVEDRRGRLYLFTNKGVARLTAAGTSYEVSTFSLEDGLPSNEFNLGAGLCDRRGRVWGGSVGGAVVFDPEEEMADRAAKPLVLDETLVGRQARPVAGASLSHRESNLAFVYSLRSFFRDGDTRYRTQLAGRDAEPSDWVPEGSTQLGGLSAGSYAFRVWGRDYAGNVSGPLEVKFRIRPAPWASLWAVLAYGLAFAAVVAGAGRLRHRRLVRRTQQLEMAVAAKTSDLVDSNRRLQEAQERIAALMSSSGEALQDLGAWSAAMSAELARAVGAREIAAFGARQGVLTPLFETPTPAPPLQELEREARREPPFEPGATTLLPVRGPSGELCGALVVQGDVEWGPAERRLVLTFAHQLGGALELSRLKAELLDTRGRRVAVRRELLAQGIDLVRVCPACHRCYGTVDELCPQDGRALEEPRLLPVVVASRYRLTELLGEGGMGTVFAARDERLGREVALKVIKSEHLHDAANRLRFEQEARALARIDHPGVVAIFDSGELEDGSLFLVTERLHGRSLKELLSRHGRGSPREVALLLRQGSAALGAAHRAGLIHRDIKPENIFVVGNGDGRQMKLLDFGVAKPMAERTDLTQTGIVIGTPGYMSPEQLQGKPLDKRADIYSFAAVAFEALTGERWIRGEALADIFVELMLERPRRLGEVLPGTPEKVDAAFARALARVREERPREVESWVASFVEQLEAMPGEGSRWG